MNLFPNVPDSATYIIFSEVISIPTNLLQYNFIECTKVSLAQKVLDIVILASQFPDIWKYLWKGGEGEVKMGILYDLLV